MISPNVEGTFIATKICLNKFQNYLGTKIGVVKHSRYYILKIVPTDNITSEELKQAIEQTISWCKYAPSYRYNGLSLTQFLQYSWKIT